MIVDFVVCATTMLLLKIVTPWWWWIMVVPFVLGLVRMRSGWFALLIGTSSASLLWLASSTYYYFAGSQIVAGRVATMIGLSSPLLLILITAGVAAVAGGIACSAGCAVRSIFAPIRP